jgi:putative ATPase
VISLAERVPAATQRIYRLVDSNRLDAGLIARWQAAEEEIYTQSDDPLTNWGADDLAAAARAEGLSVELQVEVDVTDMQVTPALLKRWFTPAAEGRRSYVDHLGAQLAPEEIAAIRALCEQQLRNQTVAWHGQTAFLVAQIV